MTAMPSAVPDRQPSKARKRPPGKCSGGEISLTLPPLVVVGEGAAAR